MQIDLVDAVRFLINTGTAGDLATVLGDQMGLAMRVPRRERIATATLAGMLAHSVPGTMHAAWFQLGAAEVAAQAVRYADALMAALDAPAPAVVAPSVVLEPASCRWSGCTNPATFAGHCVLHGGTPF
jgi:hypothetical protein